MPIPTIAIIDFSDLTDAALQKAIRAINRQVTEDFMPVWGSGRRLRLYAPRFEEGRPDMLSEDPVRGDSVIYIVNEATLRGALGYHDRNSRGIPVGFVFLTPEWTVTLSHEVLELIVDPTANVLVPGPDPRPGQGDNIVLHAYEVCDAVERTSYNIDGVDVSNFVTPQYFTPGDEPATRNDFLGLDVSSFGQLPGCHLGFFDLAANEWVMHTLQADKPAPLPEKFKAFKKERTACPEEAIHAITSDYRNTARRTEYEIPDAVRRQRYAEAGAKLRAARTPGK